MSTINISSLKNQLSAVLRRVRRGEEVLVMDRDRPVARLSPARHHGVPGDDAAFLAELERRGVITPAARRRPTRQWIEQRILKGVKGGAVRALLAEREEGL
ncbi:MAG: type II toxin-antitoxin system prevent-host-death family antitoxin [Deltaproteobacteria bacterium]|nr:type II toxin-antitoxin system prevent-host-death family antitoxin [Deltaproteobacteria bacterium]